MGNTPYTRGELEALIKDVMGITSITPMISKHINEYVMAGWSFKDIARCIVWYTEVAGKTLEPIYGLGMIKNVRELADNYFKKLELDQQRQAEEAEKVVKYQDNNIIFNIKQLTHKKRKPKQFDISEINVEGDKDGNN